MALAIVGCGDNREHVPASPDASPYDPRPFIPDEALRLAEDYSSRCPVMVGAGDGFLLAWQHELNVRVARLDAEGRPTGSAEELGRGGCPALTRAGDTIAVVWDRESNIWFARFDDGGMLLGDPTAATASNQFTADVAVAGDANGYAILWSADLGYGGSRVIRFAGLDSEGGLVDGPRTLAAPPEGQDWLVGVDGPAVATRSSGLVAVWYGEKDDSFDEGRIEMHLLERDGTESATGTWYIAEPPNADADWDLVRTLAAPLRLASSGTSVAVGWSTERSVSFHVTSAAAPSLNDGVVTTLATMRGRSPSITTAASADGYLVAWSSDQQDYGLGDERVAIEWARFDPAGQQLGAIDRVHAGVRQDAHSMAVAQGAAGHVVVFATWDDGLFSLPLPE